jgi:hypothetical protein
VVLLISAALHRVIPTYFYISLLSIPIAALIAYAQFKCLFKKDELQNKQIAKLVLSLFVTSTALLSFSFHSTVPLNVDRSFSVWMINKVATDPKMSDFTTLEENAAQFFSPENGEIKRRLNEQIELGNIKVTNNRVELTPSGERVWKSNRFLALIFNLNRNYAG